MRSTATLLSNAYRLAGKTCLITGGSQGIGFSIAKRFADEGASVVLLARKKQALESASELLPIHTGSQKHSFVEFDISNRKGFDKSDIGIDLSSIDILVNSAGISQSSLLVRTPKKEVDSLVDTNLLGTIYACQSLIMPMIRRRSGCIINISSVLGLKGVKGTSVYSATKAGIIGFTKSLAVELASRNIRVNAICPGLVDTSMGSAVSNPLIEAYVGMSPTKKLIPAEEIANAALSIVLLENMNGAVLTVDGGFTA